VIGDKPSSRAADRHENSGPSRRIAMIWPALIAFDMPLHLGEQNGRE
jgi:hypothetical protein